MNLLDVADSKRIGPPCTVARAVLLLMPLLFATTPISAQVIDVLGYAPDITVSLGGTVVEGGVLAADDLNGSVTIVPFPNLPAEARVAAAHHFANGDLLLAFESTVVLPGAGIVEPRDLVRFSSGLQTYSVEVHGADLQIPIGAAIDAVTVTAGGTILLSLDVSVGGFDDEDVIAVDGTNLTLFLDTSAVGIDPALDVDGLDINEDGDTLLFLSFDGSGTVDGVSFDDEDVLLYDMTTQTWSLAYDGSAANAQWPDAADLTALSVLLVPPPTATATATATSVATGTATGTAVDTPAATVTLTATATRTPASSATGTATATPTAPPDTRTQTAPASHTPTSPLATSTATANVSLTPTQPVIGTATATATTGIPCAGDCDGSGEVIINELITLVNIALDSRPVSACPAGDVNTDGMILINEIVTAVANALGGCPG